MPPLTLNSDNQKRTFYPSLDGLRGTAILAVIAYHNFPKGNNFFGWLGVDLFFVLSGFLITSILLGSIHQKPEAGFLKRFYIRRVLRIFPLYYLIILLFLFILPALHLFQQETTDYVQNRWWYVFYIQNWLYVFHFPVSSHFLDHFWSLSVEEQYYLLWPVTMLILRKPRKLIIFLLSMLLVLFAVRCLVWNAHWKDFNYTNFYNFTRFDGIIIGSLVAVVSYAKKDFLLNHTATVFVSLAILNLLFYYLNSAGDLPYYAFIGYTTFAAMFGLLVYDLTQGERNFFHIIFSLGWLRYLGKISYGLYIFHWPIHYFLRSTLNKVFQQQIDLPEFTFHVLTAIITTMIAIAISIISFNTFERIFLNYKKNFS